MLYRKTKYKKIKSVTKYIRITDELWLKIINDANSEKMRPAEVVRQIIEMHFFPERFKENGKD